MRLWQKILFFLIGISVMAVFAAAFDNETLKIHPFVKDANNCATCHNKINKNIKLSDPALACAPQCLTCHKEMKNHHAINNKIIEKLPEEFILTGKKRLTCITCHNLKENRFDSKSWKAESLYEKIFSGTPRYKTYFLIKKNNNGQLCKTCH
jgi:hypothetical protein